MTPAELTAHDIICIVKYNGIGGSVSATELKRVKDYLVRTGLVKEAPRVTIKLPLPTIAIGLPPIRISPPK